MSFNLSNLFQLHGNNNTVSTQGNGNISAQAGAVNLNSSAMSAKLMALFPGQMIQGEVVSAQGSQVQLLLGNEMMLNATLDSQIGINIGQLMSFQVKSNTGSLLSLVPLSVNLTMDENVMKALNEASLPVTDKTVEMVNTLMKEGMPIDKETLLNVNKELMAYPDADVETIVQMERLKLPVTQENIEQFEAYKNYNHKLSDAVTDIQNQIANLLSNTEETGKTPEFFRQLLSFIAGEGQEGVVLKQAGEADGTPEGKVIVKGNTSGESGDVLHAAVKEMTEDAAGKAETAKETGNLTRAEIKEFVSLLKELGVGEEKISQFETGQIGAKQMAEILRNENFDGGNLSKLFQSKEFGKLFAGELGNQLLLKPEQVTKETMDEYYTNLKNQTAKLMQILESAGKAETPVARSLQNINQNVDFLNQLNHMFTYVQLPLKMAGDAAHGDLYVYTNKKNLAKKDGNVSALLHLDMPHLGTLDVYVAMQNGRVSTKFYLQEESMIDFLEEHMPILTERLEKRGYQTNAEVVLKENQESGSVMEEILKQDKNIPEAKPIATRSFDVRA